MWLRLLFAVILLTAFAVAWERLDRIPIQVVGQPSVTGEIQQREQAFFEQLAELTGLPLEVRYTPVDQLGIKDTYQLSMLGSRALDLVSLRFLQNANVEPTLLGLDLLGGVPDFVTARAIADVYAPTLDRRLQRNFNSKLLGVWPFGPQVFFCRTAIRGLEDLAGRKVRVGNDNFSPLIAHFGGTPVVIPFEDVEVALKNGLVDCAITSATSGNAAGWPKHCTHFFGLGMQMGINGYAVSLGLWNRLSKEQQTRLERAFDEYVASIWVTAEQVHRESSACNVGGPCPRGTPYRLIDVVPSEQDHRRLSVAFEQTTFLDWAEKCDRLHPGCSVDWKARVLPALAARRSETQ
ncbi:MAG: hypothetical protein RIS35_1120 [Pseudomonadota bacterium]|jgi:TRAP-type C4-dicarboxylate transport system substrate-binding protein